MSGGVLNSSARVWIDRTAYQRAARRSATMKKQRSPKITAVHWAESIGRRNADLLT